MEHYDILIVGGGAAGISAAKAAKDARVLLAERGDKLGGVLLQCAHRGFGAGLDGIEYASMLAKDIPGNIELCLNTTVLEISDNKTALLSSKELGRREISFSRLILATGCREISMGALPIAGTRPEGIYTAGHMQKLMNVYSHVPQGPVVILGSGDIGLIMAAQLAEKGIAVTLVEREKSVGGMARNRRCLEEYPIKLLLNSTIREVYGEDSLEAVRLSDGQRLDCATLLIAVGLECERQIIKNLKEPEWLHLCGNCNTVHPMIESVINEGTKAGISALKNMR